ncbi:S4 domain-containing protein [Leptolyngbya sp. 7M]|uniref:S4 domain-containing protein n=1 Tax=Leptolyngbya sp. 7M TaxID=2812896 RepID=UPI001B8ABBBF|nr:S4 domain-containing protein [Leptolyngbya sp. 7M]QYO66264.1 RNA-binding S4 domain-containing protein [Leptolyngbya sp. 7M]
MRLDIFLKLSRLLSRRTAAAAACQEGRVRVNGTTAKASRSIATGDIVEVTFDDIPSEFVVIKVPETKQVSKKEAALLVSKKG